MNLPNMIRDDIDFTAYEAEPEARIKIKSASEYLDDLIRVTTNPPEATGTPLPWPKTHENFRLRENELTLWPGFNGHGKSLVIGQIMIHAMAHGDRVLIMSMEMQPEVTLKRMAMQAERRKSLSVLEAREFLEWTHDRLWMYDHVGDAPWRKLLGLMRYAAVNLRIKHFVIDSLMRCGIPDDDYAQQKQFLDALCTFRLDYPVHVHLVAHSRKREDEFTPPGKYDMKGSGSMSDLADNVVTIYRNKRKEKFLAQSDVSPAERTKIMEQADAMMIIDKQRHFTWEGTIGLWFDSNSGCYSENGHDKALDPRIPC